MWLKDEVITIDYESSLIVQELVENKNLIEDNRILQNLKLNPLYKEMTEESINEFIKKLERLSINEVIAGIPSNLLEEDVINALLKGIEKIIRIIGS
ncbi:MAG: hypothetical protein ACI94Y_004067 [Maribacter sp.]|jgi:hypothetical protein